MLKTELKLARLREELARQQERQEARKIARRKRRKADQQRKRNAAKAKQRALDSHKPSPLNLAANPFRADREEQQRAGRIRWRLETENGAEVQTLAQWCERIGRDTGAAITPVDLEAILRDGVGSALSDVVRRVTEAFLRDSEVL